MNQRDIFLAALGRRPTPRPATGSATSVVTTDLMDTMGCHFPAANLDARVMADLAAGAYTHIGFDNVMPLFSVWHESAALGCAVDWGAPGRMPDSRGAGHAIRDDIVIPPGFLSHPACRVPLDAIALLKREYGAEVAVVGKVFGPWTLGYHLYGVEEFLINTLLDPDAVRRAIERLKDVAVMFAAAQIDAGADALCFADHATRDLCSPDAYHDFLMNVHAEMHERIACPLILHICGDTSDRIGHIARTGIECFHFDAKVPARAARELAGGRLALMGGTSNFDIILDGSPEDVEADVMEKMACGIDIIGPECAVPLDAPWRTLKHLADTVKAGCGASPSVPPKP